MEGGCLRVRPYSGALRAVDVLHDLVLDITEYVVTRLVFLLADLGTDFDEEGVFLL